MLKTVAQPDTLLGCDFGNPPSPPPSHLPQNSHAFCESVGPLTQMCIKLRLLNRVCTMQESELLHELDVLHEEPRAALSSASSSSSSGVRSAPARAYKHRLNLVVTLCWHQAVAA